MRGKEDRFTRHVMFEQRKSGENENVKKVGWKRIKKEAMQSLFDAFLWKL